ncbi:hypothetical protein ACFYO1_02085 [Nocardia sp. NPDC006044]|uniref:hypothetical protein n=1 Tax=Nocardia sp. NPDC006044 TaxID=3364306 RepID=UPI00368774C4
MQDNGDALYSAYRFAANWAALVTIVFGAFAILALLPGFITLDGLTGMTKLVVRVDIIVAMGSGFLAATLAGAAIGVFASSDDADIQVDVVHHRLHWSIVFGVLTALSLVGLIFVVVLADR